MRAIGVLVAFVIAFGAGSARADSTEDDKQIADKLFIEGRELLATDAKAACAKFHAAQEKQKESVAILLNLGVCYEKQGLIAQALKWYRKTQTAASESTDTSIKEYEDAAKEATGRLASKVAKLTFLFGAGTSNVEVYLDGLRVKRDELIVEVDKGEHTIESRQPGKTTRIAKLPVADGQQLTHQIDALGDAPKPGRSIKSRRLISLGIVVGVTAGAAIGTGIHAKGIQKDFKDGKIATESAAHDRLRKTGYVFGAISLAGVGLAAVYYFIISKPGKPKGESMTRTAVSPVLSPDQAGVALIHRF